MSLELRAPKVVDEFAEFIARRPSDEEILNFHASEAVQNRVSQLLAKNRSVGLTDDEEREMDEYEYIEHLVAMLKAKTQLRIQGKLA